MRDRVPMLRPLDRVQRNFRDKKWMCGMLVVTCDCSGPGPQHARSCAISRLRRLEMSLVAWRFRWDGTRFRESVPHDPCHTDWEYATDELWRSMMPIRCPEKGA